jgi:cysteinyl-tRNA synthetase
MSIKLYNSYAKGLQEFTPQNPPLVTMYTCGPTVYGRPHIGNYSSFLFADLLRRWLEVHGYNVKHVKNITDVGHLVADADTGEDKIEKQAKLEKIDPLSIAQKYTELYLDDERQLGMLQPFARPKASETISEMITIIETLVKNGFAYETEDGVYFSVETFPKYGTLSGNTLDHLSAGARIAVDEKKKHPADFALWKKLVGHNAGHILRWPSPWGEGFPGWHIECSAMSTKFLGTTIDIHTGGEDNIFPHHECELAQSECASKQQFVRCWVHRRRIDIDAGKAGDGEKMSKSLGNVITLSDVQSKGYHPLDLRYLLLSVHYRTRLKFSWKGLDDAHKARRKINEWMDEVHAKHPADAAQPVTLPRAGTSEIHDCAVRFRQCMDDDLNVSGALAAVFDAMAWSRKQTVWSPEEADMLIAFLQVIRHTFGCFEVASGPELVPADVTALMDLRTQAKATKNFAESDRLRDEIKKLGYEVRDAAGGQTVKKL